MLKGLKGAGAARAGFRDMARNDSIWEAWKLGICRICMDMTDIYGYVEYVEYVMFSGILGNISI